MAMSCILHLFKATVWSTSLEMNAMGMQYASQVKFICIAHFMYKTIQSALHKIKALQRGVEEALK